MTRKAKSGKTKKAAPAKKAKEKVKKTTAYIVVREIPGETTNYTEPDRLFGNKGDAMKFAAELNHQMRAVVNPFEDYGAPDSTVKGGEKAFIVLVKKLKLPVPEKEKSYNFIEWDKWWDRHYFDMTDAQRETLWDAMTRYRWYQVQSTTVED